METTPTNILPCKVFMGRKLYTRQSVEALLEKSPQTLDRYMELGKIVPARLGEDRTDVMFFEEEILAYLERDKAKKKSKRRGK